MSESDAVVVITDCLPQRQERRRRRRQISSETDDVILLDTPNETTNSRSRRRIRINNDDGIVDLTCTPASNSPDLVDLTTSRNTSSSSIPIAVSSPDLLLVESPSLSRSSVSNRSRVSEGKGVNSTNDLQSSVSSILRLNCPVCLEPLQVLLNNGTELRSTVCGHVFCRNCISTAIRSSKKCPTCRKKLTERQTHPLYLPIG